MSRRPARGAGIDPPDPVTMKPLVGGRISSWPYGSASGPVTTTMAPLAGGRMPSGTRTTMPPVASAIAISGGVPSRPASAITIPLTVTVEPTGRRRASAMDRPGLGCGEADGVGEAVGVGGALADGAGLGLGDGGDVGSTVGVGRGFCGGRRRGRRASGSGRTANSPSSVAWRR